MNHSLRVCAFFIVIVTLSACSSSSTNSDTNAIQPVTFSGSELEQQQECASVSATAPENTSVDYIGNIWREEVETDSEFLSRWNQVSPENAGKWRQVEEVRDAFTWQRLDTASAYANNNAIDLKFHTLVWGANQPRWIDTLSIDEQIVEIEQWMEAIATRFPNAQQIDVVNEPLHSVPSYRLALESMENESTNEPGEWNWVVNTFAKARTLFPQSELLLNDFNIVHSDNATTQYLEIIQRLQQDDLIDGIGIQAHFLENKNTDIIRANLNRLGATGLPVYVSEFDLNIADDQEQLNRLQVLFPLFYTSPHVKGITFWGYRENQHWQPEAHLINADGTTRPAMKWLDCYLQ